MHLQSTVNAQAQRPGQRHIKGLSAQNGFQVPVRAALEFDQPMTPGTAVLQGMIQIKQAVVGLGKQNLRPLALDTGGTGHEQAVPGQMLHEIFMAARHFVKAEPACRTGLPLGQPVPGFLDAQVANRIAGAGPQQRPVPTGFNGGRQVQLAQ